MRSPDDLAERTARATRAAAEAGRDLGLTVDGPRVLYDVFSVVVHLAPAPVVVRVPTVLPPHAAAHLDVFAAQQRRELDVTQWLADHGHRAVRPSPLVPREPVRRDGFSMTFWELVADVVPAEQLDGGMALDTDGTSTAALHAALRDYPGELEFLTMLDDAVADMIDRLPTTPGLDAFLTSDDIARVRREHELISAVTASRAAFEAAFPGVTVQPIQGDAPYYNVIPTPTGLVWSDFEHVTLGPVEWDLASVPADLVAGYVRAGGTPLDPRAAAVMDAARGVQLVASLALCPELPLLYDALGAMLPGWRETPVAGGL